MSQELYLFTSITTIPRKSSIKELLLFTTYFTAYYLITGQPVMRGHTAY
jgi:hypothetical protein